MKVSRQSLPIEDLLHAIGLDGGGQAEFKRAAPDIGNQVATQITTGFVQDGEKAELRGRDGLNHGFIPFGSRHMPVERARKQA